MKTGGDVFLDQEVIAKGLISLRSARVGGSAWLGHVCQARATSGLDAAGMQVAGSLV